MTGTPKEASPASEQGSATEITALVWLSPPRTHSRYSGERYEDLPPTVSEVRDLPSVTKRERMARFDDLVTDSAMDLDGVRTFVADPSLIGHPYRGMYLVATTTGSTGVPAVLLHDRGSIAVWSEVASRPSSLPERRAT